jgi:hypothetical protein
MLNTIKQNNYNNNLEYKKKVEWIIENTIDFLDFFSLNGRNYNGGNKIIIPDLKGKSSIKFLEKYITKKDYLFKNLIKPYSELDIQNGMMAMDIAVQRLLGLIGEKE